MFYVLFRVFSIISGVFSPYSGVVESCERVGATLLVAIAKHVEGDTVGDMLLRADPVDGLLHLTVAPVAALYGIRSRGQQLVVEKRQRLVEIGRVKFAEELPDIGEPPRASAQF